MKLNKFLATLLSLAMVFAVVNVPVLATENTDVSDRPTATVTEIENDNLIFALNFKADEVTDEQYAKYKNWYADFELTVNKEVTFNADGTKDGFLSGQYDAWSVNWVNVPFGNDVTLKAGEPFRIMAYAAELMGKEGLKITYSDIVKSVKDFDCGVFFTPEFLAANPDLVVTLELKMYNPENEEEAYTIGKKYVYDEIPALEIPKAEVTEIENEALTFALNFKAADANAYQLAYYGDWYADFELSINKDVTFNANGGADGYLSGQYDAWSENWVNVPFSNVTVKKGEPVKIMALAAELMGKPGLKYTYREVYDAVKDFDCGVYFTPEFLAANPDLEVTLELKMYNNEDETESCVIGETYSFEIPEIPTATVTELTKEQLTAGNAPELTFALNFEADEVTEDQVKFYGDWYADFELSINKNVKFGTGADADAYLAGQYDIFDSQWLLVPDVDEAVLLEANTPVKIMETAALLMGSSDLKLTYNDILTFVKDFDCGVFFTPKFLAANPDLEVTLELKMYNPENAEIAYTIGRTYEFDLVSVDVDMGENVTVSTNQAKEGNLVVVAAYDKEGRLLETKAMTVATADFDAAVVEFETGVAEIGIARAFLLDGFDNLTPLCKSDVYLAN